MSFHVKPVPADKVFNKKFQAARIKNTKASAYYGSLCAIEAFYKI